MITYDNNLSDMLQNVFSYRDEDHKYNLEHGHKILRDMHYYNQVIKLEEAIPENINYFIAEKRSLMNCDNWYLSDYFTPLQIVMLSHGLNPDFFEIIKTNNHYNIRVIKNKSIIISYAYLHIIYIKEYKRKNGTVSTVNASCTFKKFLLHLNKLKKLLNVMITNICEDDKNFYTKNKTFYLDQKWYNNLMLHKSVAEKFLQSKNIESEFFNTNNPETDFYRIPKNHKCVTPKTKALLETLLHFIDKEQDLHGVQSGVKDTISQYIIDHNTYKIAETAIKKEITPILNWTHKS